MYWNIMTTVHFRACSDNLKNINLNVSQFTPFDMCNTKQAPVMLYQIIKNIKVMAGHNSIVLPYLKILPPTQPGRWNSHSELSKSFRHCSNWVRLHSLPGDVLGLGNQLRKYGN